MRRAVLPLLLMLGLAGWLSFSAAAADTAPEEALSQLYEALPETVRDELPPEAFGAPEKAAGVLTVRWAADKLSGFLTAALRRAVGSFASVLGVLLIGFVQTAVLAGAPSASPLGRAAEYLCLLCLTVTVWQAVSGAWETCAALIGTVTVLTDAVLPILGALIAAGGGVTTAAVRCTGLSALVTLLSNFTSGCLFPALRICFGLAIAHAVSPSWDLSPVIGAVKNALSWLTALMMTVLCAVLGWQSTLTGAADSLLTRTVRFAVGSFVPVVGSAVGEAMRTVSGSLSLIRAGVGTVTAAALLAALLPPLLRLGLSRLCLSLLGALADAGGGKRAKQFLFDVRTVFDFALALSVVAGLFSIFAIALLTVGVNA